MITILASLLSDTLKSAGFRLPQGTTYRLWPDVISHLGGMVKTQSLSFFESSGPGQDNQETLRRLPIDVVNKYAVETQDYAHLVPDASKRCIVYFEGGLIRPYREGQFQIKKSTASLSLVCWYNADLFANKSPQLTGHQLSQFFMETLAGNVLIGPYGDYLQSARVTVIGEDHYNPATFSRYSYEADKSGFMNQPFGFFQLDLVVEFVSRQCTLLPIPSVPNVDCC